MKINDWPVGFEPRRELTAQVADVDVSQVIEVSAGDVIRALRGTLDETVLDVATKEPALFWRVGNTYYIDSIDMNIIADIRSLRYDFDLGLHEIES